MNGKDLINFKKRVNKPKIEYKEKGKYQIENFNIYLQNYFNIKSKNIRNKS